MNKITISLGLGLALLLGNPANAASLQKGNQSNRQMLNFDASWKFFLGDDSLAYHANYADAKWRTLCLPHDWSIEQGVDKDAPAGNDGGYYPTGIGWYRKNFKLPASYRQGDKVQLYFEGVYMNSSVYVNGKRVGGHPYGYTSFFCDITDAVEPGKNNVVAVRVDNAQQKNCRWYSGSGIYRHVKLICTPPVHIANWGVNIQTKQLSASQATVVVSAKVKNETSEAKTVSLSTSLENGGKQSSDKVLIPSGKEMEISQEITVENPKLWDLEHPNLYQAAIKVMDEDNKVLDEAQQTFGIRELKVSTDGFFLNGKKILINGGCVHHDNGILGAAAFDKAEERKVRLMKEAGFNAIRTSHNLPSEAFLDACDRLGMLVIDEAFDGWRDAKNTHDYSTLFDKYWQQDVDGMVLRDRRHPSIISWSIGNEVIERKKLEVVTTAHKLAGEVHRYDARPVTSALASWDRDWEIYDPLAAQLDVTGYNYMIHKSEGDHQRVPDRIMWQTESYPRDAFKNWEKVHDHDYIIGDFVWTGIDYLGESGIGRWWYDGDVAGEHYHRPLYPWHAAYCGDIDLTGWRKPISHYRSMLYNDNEKLYLAVKEPDGYNGRIRTGLWAVWPTWESWNWPGHEGKSIEVEVYSKYPKVRLLLDDKVIAEKEVSRQTEFKAVFAIPYQPGTLKAEALQDGKVIETRELSTASEPVAIRAIAEDKQMKADGEDLAFIQVEVVDKDGRVCPNAELKLQLDVTGAGVLAVAGNADIKDLDPYTDNKMTTWKGRGLVVLRSTTKPGNAKLTIRAQGMKPVAVSVPSKR